VAYRGRSDVELDAHVGRLDRNMELAVRRAVALHRQGADEDAVLAETVFAFRAARSLEALTGLPWEDRLETVADRTLNPTPPESQEPHESQQAQEAHVRRYRPKLLRVRRRRSAPLQAASDQ
jgi:hypothetical protein